MIPKITKEAIIHAEIGKTSREFTIIYKHLCSNQTLIPVIYIHVNIDIL